MVPDEIKEQLTTLLGELHRGLGNEQLWERLYKSLRSFVWAISYRSLSGDVEMASDATQETFFRLFRYTDFSAFETPEQFLAYVATVARHASASLKRRASEHSAEDLESVELPNLADREPQEFAAIVKREILERLDEPDRRLAWQKDILCP
jgi:DNA-directed RNA polymerase specialized sigma24 family protein